MALMEIIAYTNNSENNVMYKSLTSLGSYTVKPTEKLDIENPSFIINYSPALIACNYIFASEYNRFYFAKITTKPGNEAIIECVSDPLMSFRSEILNCDILATRAESFGAPTHYPDSMLPVYPSKKNVTSIIMQQQAASPLSGLLDTSADDCYLLTVLGGQPHTIERGDNNGESESESLGYK